MHPNTHFRKASFDQNTEFARDRAFGALSINAEPAPLLAHVPFLLGADGQVADLHLVCSNPIARRIEHPMPAVISVTGPDGYVSPDWYEAEGMVPTWNYVAVHLRGELSLRPLEELPDLLARQSAAYEARIDGKAPWTLDKLTDQQIAMFLRMIVPARFEVHEVHGTWKLGQNRETGHRQAAAARIHAGFGQELAALARLMDEPPA